MTTLLAHKRIGTTERLAAAGARHPRRMLAIWTVLVVLALALVATSLRGLTTSAHVVGTTQTSQAEALYRRIIGTAAYRRQPTDVVIVSSTHSTVDEDRFQMFVSSLVARLRSESGITDVDTALHQAGPLVSANGHAALVELRAASDNDIKPVVRVVQTANGDAGFSVAITGDHSVNEDFAALSTSDLRRGELDFGLPIAIVVLLLVFGTVVAGLIPVLMAILSIVVGLGIAAVISQFVHLSVFIVNMMTGMGLALGIDYSLLVVSRFREERALGLDKEAAIGKTGATASRAVLVSGITFVVALLGMFLPPVTILRSLAAGAVIVGVVSVSAALTLLPAMLSLIGDGVNRGRLPVVGRDIGRSNVAEGRMWRAIITRVLRNPTLSLVLAGGFMMALATPLVSLHIGQSGVNTLPDNLPSKQGYLALQHYFPGQDPDLVGVIAVGGGEDVRRDLSRLEAVLADDPRFGPGVIDHSSNDRLLSLAVPIRGDAVSSEDVAAVRDLRQRLIPSIFGTEASHVLVGGRSAATADYFDAVTTPTPYVLLFVLGLSFILLMVAFRSIVIAAVSILLNLLSVGAAYGLLTFVFIHGMGAGFFGFQQVGAIDAWVPLFLFCVLFALSMDYQVFLMSRIKERYDQSGSTRQAVADGVASTARIITGAALIIVAVFAGFARGQLVQFQEMGFGVAVALLLDATLIRSVILPSILSMLDERSWYLPGWLEWIPRFSPTDPGTSQD